MWFFAFIALAITMVVVYLLLPTPKQDNRTPDKAGADDFTWPTNNNARSIPILYGSVWMHGNTLEASNLRSVQIWS